MAKKSASTGGEAIDLGPGCYDQDIAGAHGTQLWNDAFGDSLRTGVQEGGWDDGMEMDGMGCRENVGHVFGVFGVFVWVNNTFTRENMENGLKTLRLKSILSWSYLKTLVGGKGEDNIRSTHWPPLCAGSGCSGERIQRYGFCIH